MGVSSYRCGQSLKQEFKKELPSALNVVIISAKISFYTDVLTSKFHKPLIKEGK